MKRNGLIVALTALGLLAAVVNAQFNRDFTEEFLRSDVGSAFMQAYGALKSNYLYDVDDEAIVQGAIEGMIGALDDRFSYYADPEATARRNEAMSGSFEGIGAVLTPFNRETGKGVETLTVYRDGPAWDAGLQRGDIFVEVDGENVEDFTPSEVANVVRGPKGSEVVLKMRRPGEDDLLIFSIERGTIRIVDVESTVLPGKVGYITLKTFANRRLHDQLVAQLDSLKAQGIESLILDLRDNGGGFLDQGILVADEFLSEGDIVFQRSRGVTQRLAEADAHAFDLPMVVLVNANSASASEIVAGALQENGRAVVIGEETFGKGVAQNVLSLRDGGQLVYTSFEWLTPERNSIASGGIAPDIEAEDTRFPDVISLSGQGASPGQQVDIVIDGETVGSATVNEEGGFTFVTRGPRAEISEVQGEALVNLEADSALQVAYDALEQQIAASR